MKAISLALALLLLGWLAGCGERQADQAPPAGPDKPAKTITGEDVKRKIGEAADVLFRYSEEQTAELREEAKKRLADMDVEIARMKAKAEDMTGEAKARMQDRLNNLTDERAKVEQKLDELGTASGKAWEEVKTGLESSWSSLKSSFEKAADEFRSAPKNE